MYNYQLTGQSTFEEMFLGTNLEKVYPEKFFPVFKRSVDPFILVETLNLCINILPMEESICWYFQFVPLTCLWWKMNHPDFAQVLRFRNRIEKVQVFWQTNYKNFIWPVGKDAPLTLNSPVTLIRLCGKNYTLYSNILVTLTLTLGNFRAHFLHFPPHFSSRYRPSSVKISDQLGRYDSESISHYTFPTHQMHFYCTSHLPKCTSHKPKCT